MAYTKTKTYIAKIDQDNMKLYFERSDAGPIEVRVHIPTDDQQGGNDPVNATFPISDALPTQAERDALKAAFMKIVNHALNLKGFVNS